jgi:glycerol uptake facilitator-like aquaporin
VLLKDPLRGAAGEALGAAFLAAAVVGSGIMAERLCGGNVGLALLANAIATGAALIALIATMAPVSGAHLNPAVTLSLALDRAFPWRVVPVYALAQVLGAYLGVAAAHLMFGLPLFSASGHARAGAAQAFSEAIATFGLLLVIKGSSRWKPHFAPVAVAAYIVAAYWFTSSTSFANPALTLARAATDTFSGIRPADIPVFLASQIAATVCGTYFLRWLMPSLPETP